MKRVLRRAAIGLLVVSAAMLNGCTTSERTVIAARSSIVGLSQADIRMCAGFPQRTSRESDGSEIWSYETAVSSGGVTVNAPVLFGAASTSVSMKPGGGNCRAQIRFVDGRAVRLTYAGDNDTSYGRNTVCAPIVAACVDYAREIAPAPAMSAAPASISVRTPDAAPPDPGRYSSSP